MQSYEKIIEECGGLVSNFLVDGDADKAAAISASIVFALKRVFEDRTAMQIQEDISRIAGENFQHVMRERAKAEEEAEGQTRH